MNDGRDTLVTYACGRPKCGHHIEFHINELDQPDACEVMHGEQSACVCTGFVE